MSAPGVDGGLERREVHVAEPVLRHVGRVVVAACLGLSVGGEVLRARHQLVARAVVAALGALDARGGEHRVQVGILAGRLGDPAPPRLVGDVHHRRVGLLEADGCRLARAVRGVVEGDLRVEARARAQRDREDRAEAVNRVEGEQDRDLESRLLNGHPLELPDPLSDP